MAKKKARNKVGRPPAENPKRRVVSFRVSEEFGVWFDSLARETRIPPAAILELALIQWAKEQGFKPAAPER